MVIGPGIALAFAALFLMGGVVVWIAGRRSINDKAVQFASRFSLYCLVEAVLFGSMAVVDSPGSSKSVVWSAWLFISVGPPLLFLLFVRSLPRLSAEEARRVAEQRPTMAAPHRNALLVAVVIGLLAVAPVWCWWFTKAAAAWFGVDSDRPVQGQSSGQVWIFLSS